MTTLGYTLTAMSTPVVTTLPIIKITPRPLLTPNGNGHTDHRTHLLKHTSSHTIPASGTNYLMSDHTPLKPTTLNDQTPLSDGPTDSITNADHTAAQHSIQSSPSASLANVDAQAYTASSTTDNTIDQLSLNFSSSLQFQQQTLIEQRHQQESLQRQQFQVSQLPVPTPVPTSSSSSSSIPAKHQPQLPLLGPGQIQSQQWQYQTNVYTGPPTHQHLYVLPQQLTSNRCYVGNLAFSTGWQDLKDWFRRELGCEALVTIIAFPNGRSKGCAIVEFDQLEDAARAINQLSGREIAGRRIFIREDRENKGFASTYPRHQPSTVTTPQLQPTHHHHSIPSIQLTTTQPTLQFSHLLPGNTTPTTMQQYQQNYLLQAQAVAAQQQLSQQQQQQAQAQAQVVAVQNAYQTLQQQLVLSNYAQQQQQQQAQLHVSPNPLQTSSSSFYSFPTTAQQVHPQLSTLSTTNMTVPTPTPFQPNSLYTSAQTSVRPVYSQPLLMQPTIMPLERGCQIYLSNMPYRVTWQELRELCSRFGVVLRAEIALDRTTGHSKGHGTVRFQQPSQAQLAIRHLNDSDYYGRKLIARIDEYA